MYKIGAVKELSREGKFSFGFYNNKSWFGSKASTKKWLFL